MQSNDRSGLILILFLNYYSIRHNETSYFSVLIKYSFMSFIVITIITTK